MNSPYRYAGCIIAQGDERAWWKQSGTDPIKIARKLWKHKRERGSDPARSDDARRRQIGRQMNYWPDSDIGLILVEPDIFGGQHHGRRI
jgi:hypothetical protein